MIFRILPMSLAPTLQPHQSLQAAFTEASGNGGDAEEVLKGPMEENIAGSETKPASRMTGTGSSLVSGRNPFARSIAFNCGNVYGIVFPYVSQLFLGARHQGYIIDLHSRSAFLFVNPRMPCPILNLAKGGGDLGSTAK